MIEAARKELGRRLAGLRQAAGLTQGQLARRTGFGRSTVATVETGGMLGSGEFWRLADRALGARGELAARREEIAAMAAHAETARRLRQLHASLLALALDGDREAADPVVAVGRCPHCGHPLTIDTRLTAPPDPGSRPGQPVSLARDARQLMLRPVLPGSTGCPAR
jgi:transcriptional regulator with XRE-family HTH domain